MLGWTRLEVGMPWTPLDDGMLTSTVLQKGPTVVAVWTLILASCDRYGVSKLQPSAVAGLMRISDDEAELAFEILASPDAKSRNRSEEGRRIVKTEEGYWRVVSHSKYRRLASRAAAVERQQRYQDRRAREAMLDSKGRGRS